jgi:hypothetical protein
MNGGFFEDVTAEVTGRNQDSTWVMIEENPSGIDNPECWVPVSAIEKFDGLETFSVAEYKPLPPGPASITATNGVCGSNKPMIVSWSPVVDGMEYQLFGRKKLIVKLSSKMSFQNLNRIVC